VASLPPNHTPKSLEEVLKELQRLQKENQELKQEIAKLKWAAVAQD
jgi:cell shape-determining protein MreC